VLYKEYLQKYASVNYTVYKQFCSKHSDVVFMKIDRYLQRLQRGPDFMKHGVGTQRCDNIELTH